MRFLLAAAALFAVLYMLKSDLTEGTIHLAAFAAVDDGCSEMDKPVSITVTAADGDTVESLFALYPDPGMTFMDRLTAFYKLNPHLQKQAVAAGEQIELPLKPEIVTSCTKP